MKKTFILGVIAASLTLAACNQQSNTQATASAAGTQLNTDSQKLGYMLGYEFANQIQLDTMKKNGVEIDTAALISALNDQIAGKPSQITPEQAKTVLEAVSKKMEAAAAQQASAAAALGNKFLEENKTKDGVKTTESGLQYKVNKEGTGAQAALGDLVSVEYEGRLTDGSVFDSTKQHGGQAFAVPLVPDSVIAGWTEGLQLMKEGGEYTLYIPANLAYGAQSPSPNIPANSVLVFDIKVTKVEKGGAKNALPK